MNVIIFNRVLGLISFYTLFLLCKLLSKLSSALAGMLTQIASNIIILFRLFLLLLYFFSFYVFLQFRSLKMIIIFRTNFGVPYIFSARLPMLERAIAMIHA